MDTVSAYVEHGRTTPDTTQTKENQVSTAGNSKGKKIIQLMKFLLSMTI